MKPHAYQLAANRFLTERLYVEGQLGAGLFADPGLGKTLMTLMQICALRDLGEVNHVLIVAPLRPVYSVWPKEIEKWGYDFSFTILHGCAKLRGLTKDTDLHIINPEGLLWLAKQNPLPRWDMIVVDESTFFKNWTAKRTKILRKALPNFHKRMILTGTPAANSLADLFSQIYIIDGGEALGRTKTVFCAKYMTKGGYLGREWKFVGERAGHLHEAISPLVFRLDADDHLDLPDLIRNNVTIDLPSDIRDLYQQCEQELFLELDGIATLTASNAGAKYAMCRGVANGGVYESEDQVVNGAMRRVRVATHQLHEEKVQATEEIVEGLCGKPVLVSYQFHHDLERLLIAFPSASVIGGQTSARETDKIIERWNAGEIHVLLVQPQSMSHGVNLQAAGNDIVWFSIPDRPEMYQQFNARLHRQGVKGQVRIHHIIATDTVDEAVLARITAKGATQKSLLDSLKEYRCQR